MALRAPADVVKWSGPRGELEIWLAASDVVVQRFRGHATLAAVGATASFLDQLIATGKKPLIFDDWEEMTGYDSDGRLALTEWTNRRRGSLRGIHVLVRSKIVAMGIAVANLATNGIIVPYVSRAEFERSLAKASSPRSLASVDGG